MQYFPSFLNVNNFVNLITSEAARMYTFQRFTALVVLKNIITYLIELVIDM